MKPVHKIKNTLRTGDPKKYVEDGVTITVTPMIDLYWCGRTNQYLHEDPVILTEAEKKRFEREKAKLPPPEEWPICPKCTAAKEKAQPKATQ